MNTEPNKVPINIMKTLVILFLSCSFSFAQGIPIQLMVVDGDGFEMPNKQVKLRLTLTNDTSLTSGQYQEVHSITTSDLGIASVELGSGITTSNSQTLDLGLFNFQEVEPFIKTELDTNLSPTQYIELGWMRYNYPLIAQRALKADSSAYSLDASNAEYSDTAEFARNFDESLDNDTSAGNELQDLSYDQSTNTITISKGSTIQLQGSNPKIELEGVLEEVSNQSNWSASNWIAADSLYLYATSYLTNYNVLKKVLISNPDSVVSTINVGFPIFFATCNLLNIPIKNTQFLVNLSICINTPALI